jgi:hypothetical protein
MKRFLVTLLPLAACAPDLCGEIRIRSRAGGDPLLMKYDEGMDGTLDLAELCGQEAGTFAIDRPDYQIFRLVLDANVPDDDFDADLRLSTEVLPAADVAFLNSHLVPGTTITFEAGQLAGGGLHKQSLPEVYETYPLTRGTITILEGPANYEESSIDPEVWSDEWKLSWDLEFGDGAQTWSGEDWIVRHDGDTIGDPVWIPPDYMPR